MTGKDWDLVIKPRRSILDIDLKALWRSRDLIALFVRRDFMAKYKQTILGPIWFILQPVLTTVIFVIVFARIANLSTDGLPPILFYLAGTIAWTYFSTCLNNTSTTFITNAAIFGKAYFPRLTVPVSVVISTLIQFFIQLGLLFIIMCYFRIKGVHYELSEKVLLLPLLILLMALLGLGFGIIVSSLTTKYRDLTYLVTFGVQLWMYATPVVYPLSAIHGKMRTLVLINPLTSILETFRHILLGSGVFHLYYLLYSSLFAFLIIIIGVLMFNRVEKTFIDTV